MARPLLLLAVSIGSVAVADPAVTLEVWYHTDCPNCQQLIHYGLVPLVEAGLPGDQVKLLAQPWPKGNAPHSGGIYAPVPEDFASFGHECAFQYVSMPASIDSPSLISAVKFLACDMDGTSASQCASEAGLQWDGPGGIKACAEGGSQAEGYKLMHSEQYTRPAAAAAMRVAAGAKAPFVFLNEKLLEPLETPGSLLNVVCSHLADPKPKACGGDGGSEEASPEDGKYDPACESCAEVGKFHWSAQSSQVVWPTVIASICAAAGAALLLLRASGLIDFGARSPGPSLLNEAGRDVAPEGEVSQCE